MNPVNEIGKSQGHRGHRKIKCEISEALVMINLYVHSTDAKQVIIIIIIIIICDTSIALNSH